MLLLSRSSRELWNRGGQAYENGPLLDTVHSPWCNRLSVAKRDPGDTHGEKLTMDASLWLAVVVVVLFACGVAAAEGSGSAVVVDNTSAGFRVLRGEWNPSTRNEGYVGSGYLWNAKRTPEQAEPDAVEFRPNLLRAGDYKVYAHWVWGRGDRARNAPYTIRYADGSQVRRVDMSNESLAAKWHLLGVFPFEEGNAGLVELTDDADNSVVADAVKFVPLGSDEWAEFSTIEPNDLLWEETFDGDLSNWVVEGPSDVRIEDGHLFVKSLTGEGAPHTGMPGVLVWRKDDLPADFLAEWDFTPVSEPEGFFLVFFAAKGRGGEDLFDSSLPTRNGEFPAYTQGAINCYHVSYCRNYQNSVNLRKNAGLTLVCSTELSAIRQSGRTHHVELAKKGGYVRLRVDGKVCLEWLDEGQTLGPVLGAGKFGLREVYDTEGYYDTIRVYALK